MRSVIENMLRDVRATKAVNNYEIVDTDDTDYITHPTENKKIFDKL